MEKLTANIVPIDRCLSRNLRDRIFFGYYVFQLVSSLIMEWQGTFPTWVYPKWTHGILTHYVETWRDPWLPNTLNHPWYFAIVMWELFVQYPFFIVATYAYYYGARTCGFIRLPALMYSVQTITAVSGIIVMVFMEDFSSYPGIAPTSFFQRCKLASMYSMFIWFAVFILLDTLFSKEYGTDNKKQT